MMGSWAKFNKEYNMTPQDWAEWRRMKRRYRKGSWHQCPGCGILIHLSPLLSFLLDKGKFSPYCSECERKIKG